MMWAHALNLPPLEGKGSTGGERLAQLGHAIRTAVGQRRLLIVLDDAWRLEDALALRIGGPRCAYLLTTRFPLLAAQFAPIHVRHVQELSLDDSVRLLAAYAPVAIAHDRRRATDLAQTVGGLPLALSLMGHYLQQESMSAQPRRITCAFAQLEDALSRLRLEQVCAPVERPPSIPAHAGISLSRVIAVSHVRLSAAAKSLLKSIALLPAKPQTVSETLAIHLSDHASDRAEPQAMRLLDELTDSGLLESAGADGYTLHQTISDFVRSLLSADERTQQEKRIARALVTFAGRRTPIQTATGEPGPSPYQQDVGLPLAEHELNCLHHALTLAAQHELHDELVRGALILADTWQARGYYATAAQHLRRAVASARRLPESAPLAALLIRLAGMERGQGRTHEADRCLEEALQAAQGVQDEHLLCNLFEAEGMRFAQQGRHRDAESAFGNCLEQAERIGYQQQVRWQLVNLGWMAHLRGDDVQSAAFYSDGAQRAREAQDGDTYGRCIERLGALASLHGEYQQADALLRESLEILRQGQNWHYL
jgi:tetratricopeptide (TPR) repeat protein